jgi:ribonuclease R
LQVHRDGYAFLIASRELPGVSGDVFIPPDALGTAMNGDHVMVSIVRLGRDGRAEGRVVKIVDRAHPTVVGTFRARRSRNYVEPFDSRLRDWILVPQGMEIPASGLKVDRIGVPDTVVSTPTDLDGMIVNTEILEFSKGEKNPTGRVIELLGRPDDFGVDVEIIIRKHHIPHRFPPEVLAQAERVPAVAGEADLKDRQDFRDYDTVTIDGETARDFDDAVWVDRLDNGNFALHVHIADVSHYVRPGSPIDLEAELRGTSVYFPDRAVPMLPLELSTGICSLNPKVDRLTMSVLLEFNRQGQVVSQRFTRGVIRSAERMTYTDVNLILEGDAGLRERYGSLSARFEMMRELALILNRMRSGRGSIDFDLPEPLIEFDEFGEMIGIGRSPRNIANRIIEEFMLVANEAVASHLEEAGLDTLYRIHEPPDPKRVFAFEEVAARFGVSLEVRGLSVRRSPRVDRRKDGRPARKDIFTPAEGINITSRHYQKLIQKIEGKPEERILTFLMLRSLKQARYSEENYGHFALASPVYTHFTSPIRRYPDLIVHRVLGALLDSRQTGFRPSKLHQIATQCSDSERRSDEAERELVEWKKVNFMAEHVGEQFPALVVNTAAFGFFVELENLFVEGLVPVETLPGERWGYNETSREIVASRSRRSFAIGDRLTVRLDRVDTVERKLSFSVVLPSGKSMRKR